MKASLLFLGLFAAVSLHAQTNEPKTIFELHKDAIDQPLVRGMATIQSGSLFLEVRAETLTNLHDSTTVRAISLRGRVANYSDVDYIDYDEIDGLIKGLQFIAQAGHGLTPLDDFEATYRTRSGFTVQRISHGNNVLIIVQSGRDDRQRVQIQDFVLTDLTQAITAAKNRLDSLRPVSAAPGAQ